MSTNTLPSSAFNHYSIQAIKDEARQLVEKGVISRQQPIYTLCQYIPAREWVCIEGELDKCDFYYAIALEICLLLKSGKTISCYT